jgi:hypothetical protein
MTANKRGDQLTVFLISPKLYYDVKTFHEKMESVLGYRLRVRQPYAIDFIPQ